MQENKVRNTEISERISMLIDSLGVTSNAFATALGYKRSQTIYDIINGKSAPSFDFFKKLAISEYSESVNINWILTGQGEILRVKNQEAEKKEEPKEKNNNTKSTNNLNKQNVNKFVKEYVKERKVQKTLTNENTKSTKNVINQNDDIFDDKRKVQKTSSNTELQNLPEERVIVVDTSDMEAIPIIDISAAAGCGACNPDYITEEDVIRLPSHMLHKGTHHCIRITGQSMAPTFMDGGYIIIRLLDRAEWQYIKEKHVYVVTDSEGKTYIKRLKNRLLEHGFIVCMSDNPGKNMFPDFNLTEHEIHTICEVEWYMTSKMPNIHDTYYQQVQTMQDDLDELKDTMKRYMISISGKR